MLIAPDFVTCRYIENFKFIVVELGVGEAIGNEIQPGHLSRPTTDLLNDYDTEKSRGSTYSDVNWGVHEAVSMENAL